MINFVNLELSLLHAAADEQVGIVFLLICTGIFSAEGQPRCMDPKIT